MPWGDKKDQKWLEMYLPLNRDIIIYIRERLHLWTAPLQLMEEEEKKISEITKVRKLYGALTEGEFTEDALFKAK